MDGFKARLKDSLTLRLSVTLALVVVAVALVAGSFSYYVTTAEAKEQQDYLLRQVAGLFDAEHLPTPQPETISRPTGDDEEAPVIVQYSGPSGDRNTDILSLPSTLVIGLQTIEVGGSQFRVMVKRVADGGLISVAQATGIRDDQAKDNAFLALTPLITLVPILLTVMIFIIRAIVRPIAAEAVEIDWRTERQLKPVSTRALPTEFRPFAAAINRLLGRVRSAMETQRQFVADAAHELRSPLTALSLQAERMSHANLPEDTRARLDNLRSGIARSIAMVEQLLALARTQASQISEDQGNTSLLHVVRHALEDLMPLAEAKGIDVGVISNRDVTVQASELELTLIVRNLVDNAIRYSPAGAKVDIEISEGSVGPCLLVADTGPGIPEAERARVLKPFVRLLGSDEVGSGLGLSIVATTVDRIGARLTLSGPDMKAASGLRAKVFFRA